MKHLLNLLAAVALLIWGTHLVRTGILRVFGANLRQLIARFYFPFLARPGHQRLNGFALQGAEQCRFERAHRIRFNCRPEVSVLTVQAG